MQNHIRKSISIAQRFLNLPSCRKVFNEYGADLSILKKNVGMVCFYFAEQSQSNGTENVLAWIDKNYPYLIYINDIFMKRLINNNASKLNCEDEEKIIVFVMAMVIVHEFGHLVLQWAQGKPRLGQNHHSR
jgi:hypothetical protein